MRPEQITRAAILIEALDDIALTRNWLGTPKKPGSDMRVEIGATEIDGEGGGVTFLPADFGAALLNLAEQMTRDELATLGVNLDERKAS